MSLFGLINRRAPAGDERETAVIMANQILLRKVSLKDQDSFLAAARKSRSLHLHWVKVPQTADDFRRYVKEMTTETDIAYLVKAKASNALVGVVELKDIYRGNFRNAYVIYYVFEGYARHGYMTEAVEKLIHIAFGRLRLHRLEANIQPSNLASRRLAKNCGFRKEGLAKAFLKKGGEWRDHERWAVTSTELGY